MHDSSFSQALSTDELPDAAYLAMPHLEGYAGSDGPGGEGMVRHLQAVGRASSTERLVGHDCSIGLVSV